MLPLKLTCVLCFKAFSHDKAIIIESFNYETCSECLSNDQVTLYEQLLISGSPPSSKKCPIVECPFSYNKETSVCNYCESLICLKCNEIHSSDRCGDNDGDTTVFYNRALEIIKKKRRQEFIDDDIKYDLWPNPNKFECAVCSDGILPRKGVILRNCLHCICRTCLHNIFSDPKYICQLRCHICSFKLHDKELTALIGYERFVSMMRQEARDTLYHCMAEKCDGVWDVTTNVTSYQCPLCSSINCMHCGDIHSDMSCEDHRNTQRYIDGSRLLETLQYMKYTPCNHCNDLLIQDGGCSALFCHNCGNHTCVIHDSKKCGCLAPECCGRNGKYCECRPQSRCHIDCDYGCYPD